MKTNEGYVDRTIRVIAGLVLLSVLVIGPVPGWGLFGLLAVLPLATGLTGFCPIYTVFGVDTRAGKLGHGHTRLT